MAPQRTGPRRALSALLSVIIPAFNEGARLRRTLPELRRYVESRPRSSVEIIIVDDGSVDDTAAVVEAMAADWPALRLIGHPMNRGKGAAVRRGILAAVGQYVAFVDADLAAPPGQLNTLVADLADADIALLSRALPGARLLRRQRRPREWLGRAYARIAGWTLVAGLPDMHCGQKVFRAETARAIFERVREEGILFDTEVMLLAAIQGRRIIQRPAVWRHDPDSRIPVGLGHAIRIGIGICRLKLRHRILTPKRAQASIRPVVER